MANKKITDLTALGADAASGDTFEIVDVSDTTDNAAGSSKKVTRDQIIGTNLAAQSAKTLSGSDATIITGTAGTSGNVAEFNADGDIVDSSVASSEILVDGDIGSAVQAYDAVLDATTASFTTADQTKLDGIETSADVTDEANVKAALDGATVTSVTVAGTDKVLIQDASDSDNLKQVTAQSIADLGSSGTDADAIHDNVAGEINAVTEKASPVSADLIIIEDSADSNNKKKVQIGNLPGGGGGISNVVEDTTPQLGGQLDVNGQAIGDGTRELVTFTEDASAVNHINIENEATGSGPIIAAAGDDTNIDLNLNAKGSGNVKAGGSNIVVDSDIGSTVQAHDAILDATTASFTTADETKLDGIETSADVTDETNVKAALDGATVTSATVAGTDKVLIQDTSDSDNLKQVTAQSIADLGSSNTDADAIHDNVAGEINSITEKASPVSGDLLIIEDSADSNTKKKIQIGNLPGGGGGITASSTDTLTNKTIDANGTGNSISNIDVEDLANGTDGELITWDASGVATTVAAGTSGHVLTSNGAGAAPTFQAAAGGGGSATQTLVIDCMPRATDEVVSQSGNNDSFTIVGKELQFSLSAGSNSDGTLTIVGIESLPTLISNYNGFSLQFLARVATAPTTGYLAAGMGFWRADHSEVDLEDQIGFTWEYSSGTLTLNATCSNGSARTSTAITGITETDLNLYDFKVEGGEVDFYINGTLEATITTNLPDTVKDEIFVLCSGDLGVSGASTLSLQGASAKIDVDLT